MFDVTLLPGFIATETGNILLECDGNWLGYCCCGDDTWLKISIFPGNKPILNVSTIRQTEEELATHIQDRCAGWMVVKMNIKGGEVDGSDVASFVTFVYSKGESDEDEGTCPSCSGKGVRYEGCPSCPGFWFALPEDEAESNAATCVNLDECGCGDPDCKDPDCEGTICDCGDPDCKLDGQGHAPQQGDGCPECPGVLVDPGNGVFCGCCGWSPEDY